MTIPALHASLEQYKIRPTEGCVTFDSLPLVHVKEEEALLDKPLASMNGGKTLLLLHMSMSEYL